MGGLLTCVVGAGFCVVFDLERPIVPGCDFRRCDLPLVSPSQLSSAWCCLPPISTNSILRSISASCASRSGIIDPSSLSLFTLNLSVLCVKLTDSALILSFRLLSPSSFFSLSSLTPSASALTLFSSSSAFASLSLTAGVALSFCSISHSISSLPSFAFLTASSSALTRCLAFPSATIAFSDARRRISTSFLSVADVFCASLLVDLSKD